MLKTYRFEFPENVIRIVVAKSLGEAIREAEKFGKKFKLLGYERNEKKGSRAGGL
jgi:hypothetical protein